MGYWSIRKGLSESSTFNGFYRTGYQARFKFREEPCLHRREAVPEQREEKPGSGLFSLPVKAKRGRRGKVYFRI
jgi:hypothetical protein